METVETLAKAQRPQDGGMAVACLRSCPLAMAYIPYQNWGMLYDAEEGLKRGTIFKELDKPFIGKGAVICG